MSGWVCLSDSCGFIEYGYEVVYDHIENINNIALFDENNYQIYAIHSDGRIFYTEDNDRNRTYYEPYELAALILEHDDYKGGPIKLVSCYAGKYPDGAASQLAYYLNTTVKATIYPVYANHKTGDVFVLPYGGLSNYEIEEMIRNGNNELNPDIQEAYWIEFSGRF